MTGWAEEEAVRRVEAARRGEAARRQKARLAAAALAALAAGASAAAVAPALGRRRALCLPGAARAAARELDALGLPGPDDTGADFTVPTMFGEARVFSVEDSGGAPIRVLGVEGTAQSATYFGDRCADLPFGYLRAFDRIFAMGVPIGRLLMIGGGGCSYPKHVLATRPRARVDVVEVDPAVLALAWRFFFLEKAARDCGAGRDGRLGLVCADGRAYLDDLSRALAPGLSPAERGRLAARGRRRYGRSFGEPYDAVVLDAFGAGSHVRRLMSAEAARTAHASLAPGGVYAANVVAAAEGEAAGPLRSYMAALRQAFRHVWAVPLGRGEDLLVPDNVVVIATDRDCPEPRDAYPVDPGPEDKPLRD